MTQPQPQIAALASVVFEPDEPVIQSHPLLPDARVPRFGDSAVWDLNGVVRRPARLGRPKWKLCFSGELTHPTWNLLAREVAMILFNPRHPSVTAAGLFLKPAPAHPTTVFIQLSHLRGLARYAADNGLSCDMATWRDEDLRRLVTSLRERLSDRCVARYVRTVKSLHRFRPVLTGNGVRSDPWAGMAAHTVVSGAPMDSTLSTPVIPPDLWFALMRAAWTYVHTFAPDILRAHERHQELIRAASPPEGDPDSWLSAWLANPGNRIPLHTKPHPRRLDPVHWSLLALHLGWSATSAFDGETRAGRRRRTQILDAITAGHPTTTNLIDNLAQVRHSDGTNRPWHPGLGPFAVRFERRVLRNASFGLVVGLSMMRDSEIHEITRGSVVEHYGTPAIVSTKHKHDPNRPAKHWWIIEPVAEAIAVAEQLDVNHDRLFPPMHRPGSDDVPHSAQMLDCFIRHVNATRDDTRLEEIPAGRVRPHMFRRTMAMLTDQFAGSEIALGIQLKHVATRALANRATQGYAAADTAWANHLESAIEAARFRRLEDLYATHKADEAIGFGPGADRIAREFDYIRDTVQAHGGDATIERGLLRKARISLRFGVLNHCAFDDNDPAGAACLDNATVPPGHKGPLQDRCRPGRCANSVIGPEHLPIWNAEKRNLLTLLDTPGLPDCRQAVLHRELAEVHAVLSKADKDNP